MTASCSSQLAFLWSRPGNDPSLSRQNDTGGLRPGDPNTIIPDNGAFNRPCIVGQRDFHLETGIERQLANGTVAQIADVRDPPACTICLPRGGPLMHEAELLRPQRHPNGVAWSRKIHGCHQMTAAHTRTLDDESINVGRHPAALG